jgi:hypothetical protein
MTARHAAISVKLKANRIAERSKDMHGVVYLKGPKGIVYPPLALGTLAWMRRGAVADMLVCASRVWAYPFWPNVILAVFVSAVNQV